MTRLRNPALQGGNMAVELADFSQHKILNIDVRDYTVTPDGKLIAIQTGKASEIISVDLYTGSVIRKIHEGSRTCDSCNGKRRKPCSSCNGAGKRERKTWFGTKWERCSSCSGKGLEPRQPFGQCEPCAGEGVISTIPWAIALSCDGALLAWVWYESTSELDPEKDYWDFKVIYTKQLLKVLNLSTGFEYEVCQDELHRTLGSPFPPVSGIALSPDNRVVAITSGILSVIDGSMSFNLKLWDISSKRKLVHVFLGEAPSTDNPYWDEKKLIAFSPDGGLLAVKGNDNITLLDTVSGARRREFKLEYDSYEGPLSFTPDSLCFSPDGSMLAYGKVVFDVTTGKTIRILKEPGGQRAWSMGFHPTIGLLAFARGAEIVLYHVRADKEVATLKGHAREIRKGVFSSDGRLLVSRDVGNTLILWLDSRGLEGQSQRGMRETSEPEKVTEFTETEWDELLDFMRGGGLSRGDLS